jgi:hypothetical protein
MQGLRRPVNPPAPESRPSEEAGESVARRRESNATDAPFTPPPSLADKAAGRRRRRRSALHDAQSVIARSTASVGNALREEVDAHAVVRGCAGRIYPLCEWRRHRPGWSGSWLHPRIASATPQTAPFWGARREDRLRDHPDPPRRPAARWSPPDNARHTSDARTRAARGARRSRVAFVRWAPTQRRKHHWNWHPELPRTVNLGRGVRRPSPPRSRRRCLRPARIRPTCHDVIAGGGGNPRRAPSCRTAAA